MPEQVPEQVPVPFQVPKFVVDSSDTDETEQSDSNEDSSEPTEEVLNEDGANVEIDIGSELSEDDYDYSDDEK